MTPETLFENYLNNPLSDEEKKTLMENKEKLIKNNCFEKELSFGTGGVREIVEPGTNRLNKFNLARLTLALVKTVKEAETGGKKPLIVIAYDSRLTSVDFSRQTYHILKNNNISVKIFKQPTPTPLLSFAVRYLKADAGIVLTASHNTSEYNGYKVYGNDGGQLISPYDLNFEKYYLDISYMKMRSMDNLYNFDAPDSGDIIEDEIYNAYLKQIEKEVFVTKSEKKLSILYSPLHGTGGWVFKRIFSDLRFSNFHLLAEQEKPDGNFPTVKSPNPEEPGAFELLIKHAEKHSHDILITTDPDADRVGIAIKEKGSYTLLTGNQACVLLLHFLIRKKNKTLPSPYICKTIVTTDLTSKIAEANGIRVIEVLTGFKNIGAVLNSDPENYLFGGEESFGYLPVNWIRDKDSVSSAISICEMAEEENLVETLKNIYAQFGYYHDHVFSIKLTGGDKERTEILKKLDNPGNFISQMPLSRKLIDIMDLRNPDQKPLKTEYQNLKQALGKAGVVKFFLDRDATITIRPSGTEPKIKVYISLKSTQPLDNQSAEMLDKSLEIARKELADEALFLQREITRMLKDGSN